MRAGIVSVWRDGSFRVRVRFESRSERGEWLEDYASPLSKQGRKERGAEWRWPQPPPEQRGRRSRAAGAAASAAGAVNAGGEPRGRRAAAVAAAARRSFVDRRGAVSSEEDEEDEDEEEGEGMSDGEGGAAPAEEDAPPALGEHVQERDHPRLPEITRDYPRLPALGEHVQERRDISASSVGEPRPHGSSAHSCRTARCCTGRGASAGGSRRRS